MTLGQMQRRFTLCVSELIAYLYSQGYEATWGDAYRDPRLHGQIGEKKAYGHPRSAHKNRLAVDLNLFKDGVWLKSTVDHEPIGEWWEAHGEKVGIPLRWGGRFSDGNHYSAERDGVK